MQLYQHSWKLEKLKISHFSNSHLRDTTVLYMNTKNILYFLNNNVAQNMSKPLVQTLNHYDRTIGDPNSNENHSQ